MLAADQVQRQSDKTSITDAAIQVIVDKGKHLRDTGRLEDALALFEQARKLAHQGNRSVFEAKIHILIGSAQTLHFQYRAALNSLEQAVEIGRQDPLVAGSASGNMADLYWQLGDFSAAEADSKYAIKCLKEVSAPTNFSQNCLARALLIHASVCFQLRKSLQGYKDYDEAILIAKSRGDIALQALIWDEQGVALMQEHKVNPASAAFQKAISLTEKTDDLGRLPVEKEHLAELELEKSNPDCQMALRLIDEAFASHTPAFKSSPQYYPINIRGRILLKAGNKLAALPEFLRAVNAANQWRSEALPGDATSTQTVAELQEVYEDYVHLAAETALDNNDNALAINALEVLAENRAASLREQLRAVYSNNGKIPDAYFVKLAELQAVQAEATLGQNTSLDQAKLIQSRLDISTLENKSGIKSLKPSASVERIPRRNSLRDIQHRLGRDQVLISISLGKHRSYLWAVTAGRVSLSRLAGEEELTSKADLFATAIRLGHDASAYADDLTRALFANLPADVWNRSEWMLVADGPLLNGIPFCALNDLAPGHSRKLLIEHRTLRFLPSELFLTERPMAQASSSFVGIGDPIYNQADPRILHSPLADGKTFSATVSLARLVGSEKEIQTAANETRSADAVLLTGPKATRQNLTAALSHHPGVVHFAVHVVSPRDQPQQAALALSLRNGVPELLTPEAIASLHVPGSLVVLSGCSSGLGKVVPGAGLVGLSRAWLLAGAAAVVVSSWPTPDDSGRFFSSFYDHFDHITSGDTAQRAALALRRTQLDMLRGSGYQTSPAFWGAFAVIAKE